MFGGRNDREWAEEYGFDLGWNGANHHPMVKKYREAMNVVAVTLARKDDMAAAKKRDKKKSERRLRFSALSELCGRVEAQLLELMMYFLVLESTSTELRVSFMMSESTSKELLKQSTSVDVS